MRSFKPFFHILYIARDECDAPMHEHFVQELTLVVHERGTLALYFDREESPVFHLAD
jgi:hypothetical protein